MDLVLQAFRVSKILCFRNLGFRDLVFQELRV